MTILSVQRKLSVLERFQYYRGSSVLYGLFIMDLNLRSIKTNNWPVGNSPSQ